MLRLQTNLDQKKQQTTPSFGREEHPLREGGRDGGMDGVCVCATTIGAVIRIQVEVDRCACSDWPRSGMQL